MTLKLVNRARVENLNCFNCDDLENGPVQNGFHRDNGADSGVDLAAQDIPDVVANASLSNGRSSANSNTSSNNASREEHETIKRWREEHAKLLKEKGRFV